MRLDQIALGFIIVIGSGMTAYNLFTFRRFDSVAFVFTFIVVGATLLYDFWKSRRKGGQ